MTPRSNSPIKRDTLHAIRSERAKAAAIFSSIGQAAIVTDSTGCISHINQVALDILGYKKVELLGKWFPETVKMVDETNKPIDFIYRPVSQALMSGKPVTAKCFYRLRNGSITPVSITVSPVMLGKQPIGAVEVFRDISKEYEVDRMKSEFISLASHQLRTPLSAISMYTHLMLEGYEENLTSGQRAMTEIIRASANRMNELIDTLLNISQIESGKLHVHKRPVNVCQLIEKLLEEMRPLGKERHIGIQFRRTASFTIDTDPLLLWEIFANLLTNALKYSYDNSKILVTVSHTKQGMTFSVQDKGIGVPTKLQQFVFTKFFRAPNAIHQETEGTGLGLYMVREIAEALGGKVWFKSRHKIGSTFYFSLDTPETNVKNLIAKK